MDFLLLQVASWDLLTELSFPACTPWSCSWLPAEMITGSAMERTNEFWSAIKKPEVVNLSLSVPLEARCSSGARKSTGIISWNPCIRQKKYCVFIMHYYYSLSSLNKIKWGITPSISFTHTETKLSRFFTFSFSPFCSFSKFYFFFFFFFNFQ